MPNPRNPQNEENSIQTNTTDTANNSSSPPRLKLKRAPVVPFGSYSDWCLYWHRNGCIYIYIYIQTSPNRVEYTLLCLKKFCTKYAKKKKQKKTDVLWPLPTWGIHQLILFGRHPLSTIHYTYNNTTLSSCFCSCYYCDKRRRRHHKHNYHANHLPIYFFWIF